MLDGGHILPPPLPPSLLERQSFVPPPEEVGEAGEREVEKKTTIVKLVIDYNETKVTLNSGHKP